MGVDPKEQRTMDEYAKKVFQEVLQEQTTEAQILGAMRQTLALMRQGRPDERSERARRWAVAITEMEKTFAYFNTYIINYIDSSE